jgi:hypothetical protein
LSMLADYEGSIFDLDEDEGYWLCKLN